MGREKKTGQSRAPGRIYRNPPPSTARKSVERINFEASTLDVDLFHLPPCPRYPGLSCRAIFNCAGARRPGGVCGGHTGGSCGCPDLLISRWRFLPCREHDRSGLEKFSFRKDRRSSQLRDLVVKRRVKHRHGSDKRGVTDQHESLGVAPTPPIRYFRARCRGAYGVSRSKEVRGGPWQVEQAHPPPLGPDLR